MANHSCRIRFYGSKCDHMKPVVYTLYNWSPREFTVYNTLILLVLMLQNWSHHPRVPLCTHKFLLVNTSAFLRAWCWTSKMIDEFTPSTYFSGDWDYIILTLEKIVCKTLGKGPLQNSYDWSTPVARASTFVFVL